jgi:hypothetical protein
MECNHDPFSAENSLAVQPVIGGTVLMCNVCNSTASFDVLGQCAEVARMPAGRLYSDAAGTFSDTVGTFAESPPAEHIVLDGETAKWRCDSGTEHDLGELCACTQL